MVASSKLRSSFWVFGLFAALIFMNVTLWASVRSEKIIWDNVPPTPSVQGALWGALGDKQLAYRSYGITVQNIGDTGGKITNLAEYDYEALGRWFRLAHQLDPDSSFMPFLAGYFFGAIRGHPDKLPPIIDYLELASGDGAGQKWRFLGQAAFLARFKMNDLDRALELANRLASFDNPDMALWAKQMPVFILTAQGEKKAAYELMTTMLRSEGENLHPSEVNATLDYICTRILSAHEAASDPLCKDHE